MQPPLLEVILQIHFDPIQIPSDRLQFFYRLNSDFLPHSISIDPPYAACFLSMDRNDSLLISADSIQLQSSRGISFPGLRPAWTKLLDSLFDSLSISTLNQISLSYFNVIPVEDLHSFRNYLNIGFEMPSTLRERVEFFRSEFTYKYDFGEILVWLQPDWDDRTDSYCIQLNLEARNLAAVGIEDLFVSIQQLHAGIKDVFHQILSENYVNSLPQ